MSFFMSLDGSQNVSLTTQKTSVVDGGTLNLECKSTNAAVSQYQFFLNGKRLTNSSTGQYYVGSATFGQTGNYSCKAFIANLTESDSSNLSITGKSFILFLFYNFF